MTGTSTLVFTRYLYPKYCVKHSLMIALLERQRDEAMFWGYELYFSGFEEETMIYMESLYNILYRKRNPTFASFLAKMIDCWRNDAPSHESCLGSIIYSLVTRPYDVTDFVEYVLGAKCIAVDAADVAVKKCINIILNSKDIDKYATAESTNQLPAYRILKECCRFPIRTHVSEIFGTTMTVGDRRRCYLHKWLYFAAMSPIWRERIDEFCGIIDDDTETVVFTDDELEDAFNNSWGYDPDEQSGAIHSACVGNETTPQITLSNFCERYGVKLAIVETPVINVDMPPIVKKIRKKLVIRAEG